MDSDGTVVRTRLGPDEYERLAAVAEQEEKPLEEVLREAVLAYVDCNLQPDPDDPLCTVDPPAEDGAEISASEVDDSLY